MSDAVERLNAALEGRYRIERQLGEGGMATVYLADDLKHERNVALKVLKPELAAVVGAERFLAEIKTTANLQHPHILPLFDSGVADSFLFYVMPFVEGETLRDRLDREKQLPVDEAVRIATAVAGALQHAHDRGVIHRDIKPANILIQDGQPVVADFGIALAVGAAGGHRLTETGLSLGTPYYMSPEQATGDQQIGPASDTWALACVLYEMLVGEPPYTGNTAQAVLGKILVGEPVSPTAMRASIPPNVDGAIQKALERLPADRFAGAHAFAQALGDTGFRHGVSAGELAAGGTTAGPLTPLSLGLAGVALVAIVAAALGWMRPAPEPPPVQPAMRAVLDLGLGDAPPAADQKIVISPDGDRLAFATPAGLRVRNAGDERFRILPQTEDARDPAFSPDGEWIAFATAPDGTIHKVSLSGGAPQAVMSAPIDARSLQWTDRGTIVFLGDHGDIYEVPDAGGEPPRVLVEHGAGQGWLNSRLLPGGRWALVTNGSAATTLLLDLERDSSRVLIEEGIDAVHIETGHLLYADPSGGLWAVPFDLELGDVVGEATRVFSELTVYSNRARYSVSQNGTLVYGAGAGGGNTTRANLVVVDSAGNVDVSPLSPRRFINVRWSPDGRTIAYASISEGERLIYTHDIELGTTPRQWTFEGDGGAPVWSPDGTRIAFAWVAPGSNTVDVFIKDLTDDSPPELVLPRPGAQAPTDWPAENVLVFGSDQDIWILDPADGASATPYLESEANLFAAQISPDGTLAAYQSDETGTDIVYVSSFPDPRQPTPVSLGEALFPRWAPDGNTLYYWRPGAVDTLYAARVETEPTFRVVSREALFGVVGLQIENTDLHPDGDRWVAARSVASAAVDSDEPERYLVVTNWFTELRAALGEDTP